VPADGTNNMQQTQIKIMYGKMLKTVSPIYLFSMVFYRFCFVIEFKAAIFE